MRISNGHWYCNLCGARIDDVPLSQVPYEDRIWTPGRERRILRVRGREVHRCEVELSSERNRPAAS